MRDYEFARAIGAEHRGATPVAEQSKHGEEMKSGRTVQLHGPAGITVENTSSRKVRVTKVVRGNGAHQAAIRVGDIIEAVNGTAVHDHKIAIECIGACP